MLTPKTLISKEINRIIVRIPWDLEDKICVPQLLAE
ncbi:unnamed protein product [Schistosoma mattheei]|uniref:Transposase n=2 Tax=Schistosoma TaxID=6181 RepID=A0A183JQI5_9TREM|nr:unnamed protein product [Schistosoma mattheei]VDO91969.1 unnamed protein product [Schistosoma curassoni]